MANISLYSGPASLPSTRVSLLVVMVVVVDWSDDEVSSVDADSGVVKPTGRSDFARAVVAIVLGLGIARLAEVLDELELKPAIQTLHSNIPKFVWNIGCC